VIRFATYGLAKQPAETGRPGLAVFGREVQIAIGPARLTPGPGVSKEGMLIEQQ